MRDLAITISRIQQPQAASNAAHSHSANLSVTSSCAIRRVISEIAYKGNCTGRHEARTVKVRKMTQRVVGSVHCSGPSLMY